MRISRADDAFTFDPDELVVYDSSIAKQTREKSSWGDAWTELKAYSVGLPQTSLLPNGDVLVSYYAGPEPDLTEIQWARVSVN
jgi:hypothetical protein